MKKTVYSLPAAALNTGMSSGCCVHPQNAAPELPGEMRCADLSGILDFSREGLSFQASQR